MPPPSKVRNFNKLSYLITSVFGEFFLFIHSSLCEVIESTLLPITHKIIIPVPEWFAYVSDSHSLCK